MKDDILSRRLIRREELRKLIPLADTTIYELEKAGNFPKRVYLTARCVAWELSQVEDWIAERRKALNVPGLIIRPNRSGNPVRPKTE
ncbi:MAG: AlpA family phage regulatory protein [Gammaproteobacteria bacterium]|nr:AlpA family phage regulatory protein [Rhodocyclaceae bacterium]MBU3908953.1 AlpA family phage regulatory protein [Gammaproteobacteria bacterium]MBU4005824.1 AlpA family phage regulatory protein [Gammaproteobacteria bacterium]MBU4021588.1 AlpA family phage regulatory protein [Gammaproteobacteria bacterium]MBU4094970.1 AlpA family phage regulatory protein [Gammaproteobacteria bacterium]